MLGLGVLLLAASAVTLAVLRGAAAGPEQRGTSFLAVLAGLAGALLLALGLAVRAHEPPGG